VLEGSTITTVHTDRKAETFYRVAASLLNGDDTSVLPPLLLSVALRGDTSRSAATA
jgi:hypothetical protein